MQQLMRLSLHTRIAIQISVIKDTITIHNNTPNSQMDRITTIIRTSSKDIPEIQTSLRINSRTTNSRNKITISRHAQVANMVGNTRCRKLKISFIPVWPICWSIFTMEKVLMSIRTTMRQSCQLLMSKSASHNRLAKRRWMLIHSQDYSKQKLRAS